MSGTMGVHQYPSPERRAKEQAEREAKLIADKDREVAAAGFGVEPTTESWHYKRTCTHCGCVWAGLHCIHDGYQNPCGKCGKRPTPVETEVCCGCEFDWEDDEEYIKNKMLKEILQKVDKNGEHPIYENGAIIYPSLCISTQDTPCNNCGECANERITEKSREVTGAGFGVSPFAKLPDGVPDGYVVTRPTDQEDAVVNLLKEYTHTITTQRKALEALWELIPIARSIWECGILSTERELWGIYEDSDTLDQFITAINKETDDETD